MANKIILSADSTCDIGPELKERYDVQYLHYHIQLGENTYVDSVEITPDEVYNAWREKGILPKTAAITPEDYYSHFKGWIEQGYDIVHLNLGSALSSAHSNCVAVAKELGHVYPIDSANLSTGFGHLVAVAGEMIAAGATAEEIQRDITAMREKAHASFVLDTLEFMRAGGRCSTIAAFGANLLNLKPGIEVNNAGGGSMGVGKKYRGNMEKVLVQYVKDKLAGRDDLVLDRVFITHSGSPDSDIELVRGEIAKYADFKEVFVTRASCTISSHCGPRTLGVLFMTK